MLYPASDKFALEDKLIISPDLCLSWSELNEHCQSTVREHYGSTETSGLNLFLDLNIGKIELESEKSFEEIRCQTN